MSNLSTNPVLRNAIFTHRTRLRSGLVRMCRRFAHGKDSGKAPVSEKARFAHETYSAAQSVRIRRRFAHEAASEAGSVSDKGRFAHGHGRKTGTAGRRAKLGWKINCFHGNR